jgi:uncharacterized protein (TIGR02145 family)
MFISVTFIFLAISAFAQNTGVSISATNTDPDPSAMLDVQSTDKGVLISRMTTAQRNAIANPAEGLQIYNLTTKCLEIYISPGWQSIFCGCTLPATPNAGAHTPSLTQIVWNWNAVPGATGYKWNTANNYSAATDNGAGTSVLQTGLSAGTTYTLYVWAYNNCGVSGVATLSQATSVWSCGNTLSITHSAGSVAPVAKTVNYGTATNIPGESSKCWITQNLGANNQAASATDATEAAAGWYWQFNRKQGYKYETSRTPNTAWITNIDENSDWTAAEDPCTIELGNGWRIPTRTEWTNVDATGNWNNLNNAWSSDLKLHASGLLFYSDGVIDSRSLYGYAWSSTQSSNTYGWYLAYNGASCAMVDYNKWSGLPVRCVKD